MVLNTPTRNGPKPVADYAYSECVGCVKQCLHNVGRVREAAGEGGDEVMNAFLGARSQELRHHVEVGGRRQQVGRGGDVGGAGGVAVVGITVAEVDQVGEAWPHEVGQRCADDGNLLQQCQ